jgi:Sulfotransferase domain
MTPSHQRNVTFCNTMLGHAFNLPLPHTRKIDLVDGHREIPMKVLCLGYSRTGTLSLYTALQKLGYKPYHMAEAIKNADVDLECWQEGVQAKLHGKGKPWGKEDFDKLTGKFDVRGDNQGDWFIEANRVAGPDGCSQYFLCGGVDCGISGCEGYTHRATGGR